MIQPTFLALLTALLLSVSVLGAVVLGFRSMLLVGPLPPQVEEPLLSGR